MFLGRRSGAVSSFVFVAAAVLASGCATEFDVVTQRASNEFTCPRERVEVIARNDIQPGTYDLDACGVRARYTCAGGVDKYEPERCVREPDPSSWNPDPALLASLPRPPGMSGDGRVASICYQGEQDDRCLLWKDGAWRWNHPEPAKLSAGGLGARGE